jgi:hypothetical protein
MKPVGKPDARDGHVRFDERGWETGRRMTSVPAPILDSTGAGLEPRLQQHLQRWVFERARVLQNPLPGERLAWRGSSPARTKVRPPSADYT